jgi:hypothetical protein
MTDDFQLFDQSSDDPVDADIALITAYLARELSPVQIVAVEERLASDAAFLKKVGPILDAWVLPPALSAVHAGQRPLSREEVEAGWARYVGERAELDAHEAPRLVVESAQRKRRKVSMTRIAAGIAAITLPMFALAQVVVYAAKNPGVPGHSVAKEMVAPFVEPLAPAPVTPKPDEALPTAVDVPVSRQLEKAAPAVQRSTPVQVPVPETPTSAPVKAAVAPTSAPSQSPNPDRDLIIALAKQHMPEVVRGDTSVSYALIVLDAADKYVWSTYGEGALQLMIGGDSRTAADRAKFSMQNTAAYTGRVTDSTVLATARSRSSGGNSVSMGYITVDSLARPTRAAAGGGGRGGIGMGSVTLDSVRPRVVYDSIVTRRDSVSRTALRFDTMRTAVAGARGGGGGRVAVASPPPYSISLDSGSYLAGFNARMAVGGVPVPLNAASGLQDPGRGESGIQGLKATSLTMAESYFFNGGQLAPTPLRVLVVHLARGTNWKGR